MALNIWIIIILIVAIFVGSPILGKTFYKMQSKQAFILYLLLSIILTITVFLISDHPEWSTIQLNWLNYWNELGNSKFLYISTFFACFLGGMGVVGGILEFIGEQTETAEAYSKYNKFSKIKIYFGYIIYGVVFIFAIFAFSQFLYTLLGWRFKGTAEQLQSTEYIIHTVNLVLTILGNFLFILKSFRFGFFSFEYYKSKYHPSVADIGNWRRESRHILACILGPGLLFISVFLFFMETNPTAGYENVNLARTLFYLTATIQAFLFYGFRNLFVDQLKPVAKQYGIKVGKGPELDSDRPDTDLKFD